MEENTPIFLKFESQDDRREYGGTGFLELQFCKLSQEIPAEDVIAVDRIRNWKDDSLYISVDDCKRFRRAYRKILDGAYQPEREIGAFDLYGINYYDAEQREQIIQKLREETPEDYETLLDWLEKSKEYRGFYILGI